uniref:Uncharacterized protein n=1 Tax=Oryza glumipatula TaxID=40148 RepID=A0A0D9YA71_9ORYZ
MAWPTVRSARPRASHAQEKTAWAQATFDLLAVAASNPEGEKGKWQCVRKGDPTEMSETRVRLRELRAVVRPYIQEIESGFFESAGRIHWIESLKPTESSISQSNT